MYRAARSSSRARRLDSRHRAPARVSPGPVGLLPASAVAGGLTASDVIALQRTVGNTVVGSLVAGSDASIQRYFYWKAIKVDAEAKVEQSGIDRQKIGSREISKMKAAAKEAELNDRWAVLVLMAKTAVEEGRAIGTDANAYSLLKTMIAKFKAGMNTLASARASAPNAPSVPLSSRVKEVRDELLRLPNVFSEESVKELAELANGQTGYGWSHEMKLARELAIGNTDAFIQVGALAPQIEIEPALELFWGQGYRATASTIETKGRVGGDVTVWRKNDSQQRTTFIQAKTATRHTLADNVSEAANQLASLTASGDPEGKAKQREFTYTGSAYEGAIVVEYTPTISLQLLQDTALQALKGPRKQYVHRVVYKNALAADYTEYTLKNPDGKFSETNPLFNATPVGSG